MNIFANGVMLLLLVATTGGKFSELFFNLSDVQSTRLSLQDSPINTETDSLFNLQYNPKTKLVSITPPKNMEFELTDSTAIIRALKFADFNADKKKDLLVNLGECGSGGCMTVLFLKQEGAYYKLVFMDYLKNVKIKQEKNGYLYMETSEEFEAYNPTKLQIRVFKFDKKEYRYKLDSAYVYCDTLK